MIFTVAKADRSIRNSSRMYHARKSWNIYKLHSSLFEKIQLHHTTQALALQLLLINSNNRRVYTIICRPFNTNKSISNLIWCRWYSNNLPKCKYNFVITPGNFEKVAAKIFKYWNLNSRSLHLTSDFEGCVGSWTWWEQWQNRKPKRPK